MAKEYSESVIKAAKVMTAMKKKKNGNPSKKESGPPRDKKTGTFLGSEVGKDFGSKEPRGTGGKVGAIVGGDITKNGKKPNPGMPQSNLSGAAARRLEQKRVGQKLGPSYRNNKK